MENGSHILTLVYPLTRFLLCVCVCVCVLPSTEARRLGTSVNVDFDLLPYGGPNVVADTTLQSSTTSANGVFSWLCAQAQVVRVLASFACGTGRPPPFVVLYVCILVFFVLSVSS